MAVTIEGYLETLSGDQWQFVGEMVPNDIDLERPDRFKPSAFFEWGVKELAAILADDFNPVRSSESCVPLVPRRGLPADLSATLKTWLQQYVGEDSFACTWFTAREAAAFGWTRRIIRGGETYAELVPDFYGHVLPRLVNAGPLDRTRLVVALWW